MSLIEIILFSILFLLQLGSLILFSLAFVRLDYSQRIARIEARDINRYLATLELGQGLDKFEQIAKILEPLANKEKQE